MASTGTYALVAATAAAALIGGTLYATWGGADDIFSDCRTGSGPGLADALGGPFTLVDGTGATVTDADLIDRPSLLYFGFTNCPDVCPTDNARNADVTDIVQAEGHAFQPVFITVDPGRDTPEVMQQYAEWMHPDMIGLSGSTAQVKAAADAFRVYFRLHDTEDEFYLVDHSAFSYLVLPGHGTVAYFRHEAASDEVAEQSICFIETSATN